MASPTNWATPTTLRPALELLCTGYDGSPCGCRPDANDGYFIQRLYVGIEPEEQTSRESKDKYGTFAYAIDSFHRAQHIERKSDTRW